MPLFVASNAVPRFDVNGRGGMRWLSAVKNPLSYDSHAVARTADRSPTNGIPRTTRVSGGPPAFAGIAMARRRWAAPAWCA